MAPTVVQPQISLDGKSYMLAKQQGTKRNEISKLKWNSSRFEEEYLMDRTREEPALVTTTSEDVEQDLTKVEMNRNALRREAEEAAVKHNTFHQFSELPAELRLMIIHFALEEPRCFHLGLTVPYPINAIKASYIPMSKNYCSILQANRTIREEGLRFLQSVTSYPSKPANSFVYSREATKTFDVYINYDSDLMIVDAIAMRAISFNSFYLPSTNLNPERKVVQRVVTPLPPHLAIFWHLKCVRYNMPNLKELCYFQSSLATATQGRSYPFVTGGFTVFSKEPVLVDISDLSDKWMREYGPGFEEMQNFFVQQKKEFPEWKLEKIRLVIWAKK